MPQCYNAIMLEYALNTASALGIKQIFSILHRRGSDYTLDNLMVISSNWCSTFQASGQLNGHSAFRILRWQKDDRLHRYT